MFLKEQLLNKSDLKDYYISNIIAVRPFHVDGRDYKITMWGNFYPFEDKIYYEVISNLTGIGTKFTTLDDAINCFNDALVLGQN